MQTAANLAGVTLTRPELDVIQKSVKAEIVSRGGAEGNALTKDEPNL